MAALENVTRFSETADTVQHLAGLYAETGQKDKAIAEYKDLVDMAWDQPEILRQAATELKKLGDETSAAKALKAAADREAETKAQVDEQQKTRDAAMKQMAEQQKQKAADDKKNAKGGTGVGNGKSTPPSGGAPPKKPGGGG